MPVPCVPYNGGGGRGGFKNSINHASLLMRNVLQIYDAPSTHYSFATSLRARMRWTILAAHSATDRIQTALSHAKVGGESSIARFRLAIEELARIKAATPVATPYKTSSKQEVDELKRTFAFCARDGRIPKWFDFPFSKSLLLFENSGDYTDGHPSFSHKWFVDEDQCVVYFVMTEG